LDSFVNVLIQSLSDNSETKDENKNLETKGKYDA